jgi:hypothetical protein
VVSRSSPEDPAGDIQVLLEVTYENYRVVKIRDVSEEDRDYFRQQCDERYVKASLERERPGGGII